MRTQLLTPFINVSAGQTFQVQIEVYNTGALIDGVVGRLVGVDPEWVTGDGRVVSLFPDTSEIVTLEVTLPPQYPAGEHTLVAELRSTVDASDGAVHQIRLDIQPAERVRLEVRPRVVVGGRKANANVRISNLGNRAVEMSLTAGDTERALESTITPTTVLVPPGQDIDTRLDMKGKRPKWGGRVDRPVLVIGEGGAETVETTVTFRQKPWITQGVITIITLVVIVALWALIFTYGIQALLSSDEAEKAYPGTGESGAGFVTGDIDGDGEPDGGGSGGLDIESIGGSIAGVVVAETTDQALSRITVEAHRQNSEGFQLVASVATDESGAYALGSLLPGTYKLRFLGEGFAPQWFPNAPDQGAATEIALEPAGEIDTADLDESGARMCGAAGSISGTILTDNTAGGAPPTITVDAAPQFQTQVSDLCAASAPLPVEPVVANDDGTFTIGPLLTPGPWTIRIESGSFRDVEVTEDLGGGANLVINTIKLGAADGAIGGTVTNEAGNPLGGVIVTATKGDFTATTTTPTAGAVGQYLFPELETPGTYVVSFAAEGFATNVIALDLAPGEQQISVNEVLIGGAGELRGRVTATGGSGVAGATITVSGSGFVGTATSLTSGTTAGNYTVTGIPTPGTYTVTFAAEGFVDETLLVTFENGDSLTGIDAVLTPLVSKVSGTVSLAGSPTGGVGISITDGFTERLTVSATTPPGAYLFDALPPGSYTISFFTDGFVTETVLFTLVAGTVEDIDADLAAAGSITGFVQIGDPPVFTGGVAVVLTGPAPATTTASTSTGTGIDLGRYKFSDLVPGEYRVTAAGDTANSVVVVVTTGAAVAPTIALP